MHDQIRVLSLKDSNLKLLIEEWTKINLPDYNIFSNVNIAYLNLMEKILSIVYKIVPFKLREKHLKHFKSTKLRPDEEYIKNLNILQWN